MVTGNYKIAADSIMRSKWRSFFTMLGIIIGVVSVVTVVSIGQGVKNQVQNEIERLGSDLITVKPGALIESSDLTASNLFTVNTATVTTPLTEDDLTAAAAAEGVKSAVPFAYVAGKPSAENRTMQQAAVFGTNEQLPEILNREVEFGAFFEEGANKNVAVIGKGVAEQLFQEVVPIGNSMSIRGQSFVVVGVLEEFESMSAVPLYDYNNAVFIPTEVAKKLTNDTLAVQQILVRPDDPSQTSDTVQSVTTALRDERNGEQDFSVLEQKDALGVSNAVLNLMTGFITAVAAISLLVGGIGIMNVMIVSVTERTHEIGIRKAVGATNRQILSQFLIESSVISFLGGVIGVLLSFLTNFIIRVSTDLEPVVTFPIMGAAVVVSLLVGMIFGVAPAAKAARKDPIDALRRI